MSRVGFGIALCLPLLVAACGGNAQQTVARTAELDRKVSELRAQNRRDRVRIRELERQVLDAQTSEPTSLGATYDEPAPGVREKKVEVIFEDVGGLTDGDNSERAKIQGTDGNGIEVRYAGDALAQHAVRPKLTNLGAGSSRLASLDTLPPVVTEDGDERLPVTTGTVPKVAQQVARALTEGAAISGSTGSAQQNYQRAMEAIELGEYPRAVTGLQTFLKAHPNHELADNAQYWMGESYYVQKQYSSALSAFRGVVDKFPLGNKVPDALLKVGYCLAQLGDKAGARRTLERVKTEFPDTNPATLAARKLQELKE